jgi:hypothetical protein
MVRIVNLIPSVFKRRIEEEFYRSWTRSERSVEIPFVLGNIDVNKPCKVMIFGSYLDYIALYLATLGFDVVGFDLQKNLLSHKNFNFVKGNFLKTSRNFSEGTFDIAISVSSIEHAGLDVYQGPLGSSLDLEVMDRISQLLTPAGSCFVTVPFGKPGLYPLEKPFFRKYDRKGLAILLQDYSFVLNCFRFVTKEKIWVPSDPSELESHDTSYATAVACTSGKNLRKAPTN